MFDLFRSQAKAMRYLLIVLLSLVALSMVITLIPGFGSSSYRGDKEQLLAEIGDQAVTGRMIRQLVQAQIRNQQMPAQMAEFMIPQIVNQVVGEMATAYQASRMGFKVSDQEMIQQIQLLMPQLFQGGSFAGKDIYQAYLAQMNLTIPEFESKVRQQILLDKLQRVAFDGVVVSPAEVETEFRKKAETVRMEVVKLDSKDFKVTAKPSKDEMEKYLKDRQAMYQVPQMRSLGLVVADPGKLGESVAVPDADVRKVYDTQRDRYQVKERVHVRHILIKALSSASKEEKEKAKAKAEGVLKQLKAGKDFAELAKANSDDTGNANKGGDLDWSERGRFVKPFEDAAFALKPKELSGVVESEFGYHIIRSEGKEAGRQKAYDEVKDEILSELRKRQLFDRIPSIVEAARAEITKTPAQAEAIAAKHSLQYSLVDPAGPGTNYPTLGTNQDLDNAISTLAKGGVSEIIQTKQNVMAFAVALDIHPARPATLKDVEPMIAAAIQEQRARDQVEAKVKGLEEKAVKGGGDFTKVAKELGLKVLDTGDFERLGQMKEVGAASMFGEQPFVNPVGKIVGPYRVANTVYFFKIVAHNQGDLSKLAAERQSLVTTLKERKLRERRELFEEGLVTLLKSQGKVKVFDDAIKRLASSYRGA